MRSKKVCTQCHNEYSPLNTTRERARELHDTCPQLTGSDMAAVMVWLSGDPIRANMSGA